MFTWAWPGPLTWKWFPSVLTRKERWRWKCTSPWLIIQKWRKRLGCFTLSRTRGAPSLTLLAAPLQTVLFWCQCPQRFILMQTCKTSESEDRVLMLCFCLFFPDGLKHLEEMKFNKCIYIEDACLERLSSIENLQESLYMMEVVSCGNVTDKGLIALHRLKWVCVLLYLFLRIHFPDECFLMSYLIWIPRRNLEYLFLSDLPGITDKQKTVERLQTALPRLEVELDLEWPRTTSCLRLENMDIFFTGFQSKRPRLGVNYSLFILPLGKDPEVSKWLQWLELFASLNAKERNVTALFLSSLAWGTLDNFFVKWKEIMLSHNYLRPFVSAVGEPFYLIFQFFFFYVLKKSPCASLV